MQSDCHEGRVNRGHGNWTSGLNAHTSHRYHPNWCITLSQSCKRWTHHTYFKVKVRGTLSIYRQWRHTGVTEVQLHSFLTSALDEGERRVSIPGCLIPRARAPITTEQRAECSPSWSGHFEKAKSPVTETIRTPDLPAPSLVAIPTTLHPLSTF